MENDSISARESLADAFHLASRFGWTDLIYTHMSVREAPESDIFYTNEFGLLFNEITPYNLIEASIYHRPNQEKKRVINPAGWSVHAAIYKEKPDVNAIVHLHTSTAMAVSCLKEGLLPISQPACLIHKHIAYHDYCGIACEDVDNERLAKDMKDKPMVILRNHGTMTVGGTVAEAFCYMYLLEKALEVQQMTLSMGREISEIPKNIQDFTASQFRTEGLNSYELEWDALLRSLPKRFSRLSDRTSASLLGKKQYA